MKYIIDRIENGIVVCESEEGERKEFDFGTLVQIVGLKEGSAFVIRHEMADGEDKRNLFATEHGLLHMVDNSEKKKDVDTRVEKLWVKP